MSVSRKLRAAVVQFESRLGRGLANLETALPSIEAAVREGAELVVLPELSATGYRPTRELWSSAEPEGGPSETWLARTAARLGIHLAAGYLEARGEDFYNAYAIAGPSGEILGRVRKEQPAMGETALFAASPGSHVIETGLGRIGVGICNDNHMAFMPRRLREGDADLVLMPHAWPLPFRPSRLVSAADIERQARHMAELPVLYARCLGIPALFANLAMPFDLGTEPPRGLLAALLPPAKDYVFPGRSSIVDSDGRVLASLGSEPGQAVAELRLEPRYRDSGPLPAFGRRVYADNGDGMVLRLAEARGRREYRRSAERMEAARRAAGG